MARTEARRIKAGAEGSWFRSIGGFAVWAPLTDLEELIRDTLATALVEANGVDVVVDDAGNTITIQLDTAYLSEYIRDTMAAALAQGANVTITVDDAANTVTIAATGGGGGGGGTPLVREDFDATASQTIFILATADPPDARVYVNGHLLMPDQYVISGTSLTLDTASAAGDDVSVFYGGEGGGSGTGGHTIYNRGALQSTRGALDFTGAGVNITDDPTNDKLLVDIAGAIIADPRLGVPQGTLNRSYFFTNDVEAWAASAAGGTVTHDSGAKAAVFTTPATVGNYAILDPGTNITDGELVADLSATLVSGTQAEMGLIFRYVDDNNHYMVAIRTYQQTGNVTAILYKKVAGTYTVLSEADALSAHEFQIGLGARFRAMVRFVGSQISWYLNEAFVGTVTDTTFVAGGKLGVRSGQNQVTRIYGAQAFTHAASWEPNLYSSGGAGSAGGGLARVSDEGIVLPERIYIDFTGPGVTVVDDAVNGKLVVTIPGGGAAASGMIEGVGITKISTQSTPPTSPNYGDLWYKRS